MWPLKEQRPHEGEPTKDRFGLGDPDFGVAVGGVRTDVSLSVSDSAAAWASTASGSFSSSSSEAGVGVTASASFGSF